MDEQNLSNLVLYRSTTGLKPIPAFLVCWWLARRRKLPCRPYVSRASAGFPYTDVVSRKATDPLEKVDDLRSSLPLPSDFKIANYMASCFFLQLTISVPFAWAARLRDSVPKPSTSQRNLTWLLVA